MPDLKTTEETTRSPIDGTELVRLATTGANWKATLSDVFTTLGGGNRVTTAAVTYYVSTTGSDSNNGLTVGTPFRTIQKGIDTATQTYMYAQPANGTHNPIVVQLADGTYNECPFLPPWLGYQYAGAGITLQGNISDKTRVIIKPSTLPRNAQGIISQTGMSIWTISFLTIDGTLNTFYSMLDSSDGCIQFANDIKFINSAPSTSAVAYGLSCFGGLFGACEFVGSFDNVTFLSYQTTWYLSAALTFTSAPTFSTGIFTSAVDVNMYLQFISFTGSPVGPKFSLADRSFIYSNADAYPLSSLPGSLDGVMDDTSGFQDTKGFRSLAALPSATQMVPGSWGVFKNNADSTVYIAANDGGVIRRAPISAASSSGLTIGTTTITSGTTKHALYDLAGVVQEAANFTIESGNPNVTSGNAYMYNGMPIIQAQTALNNFYDGGSGNLTGTGTSNQGTGASALASLTIGTDNSAIGPFALFSITDGIRNVGIGSSALSNAPSAVQCLAIGFSAMGGATGGTSNTAIGTVALNANTTGSNNVALGTNALTTNTTGHDNLALGANALQFNVSGVSNVAIGANSLLANLAGSNLAIGEAALKANTTGTPNLAIGSQCLTQCIDGTYNIGIGNLGGFSIVHGGENVSIGYGTLNGGDVSNCVAIGFLALTAATGNSNLAIGYLAGIGITSGTGNIIISNNTGVANQGTTGSGNILIGNNITLPSDTSSVQLDIGNFIYGTGLSGTSNTVSPGLIGLGIQAPTAVLHITHSTTARANIRLDPTSAATPTSPNDGDLWYNGTNLFFRNSTTSIQIA